MTKAPIKSDSRPKKAAVRRAAVKASPAKSAKESAPVKNTSAATKTTPATVPGALP